jgi:hypothetical protein
VDKSSTQLDDEGFKETKLQSSSEDRVLNIDEIARFYKCSRAKATRMAGRGEIPAFKFGKPWLALYSDIVRDVPAKDLLLIGMMPTRNGCAAQLVSVQNALVMLTGGISVN